MLPNGQPWFRPLYTLSKHFLRLYEKLREDQLIPDDLDAALSALPSKLLTYRRSHLLYTLNDTFILDFNANKFCLIVITEQGVENIAFKRVFTDTRNWREDKPYTGAYTNHHLSIPILLY